MTGGRAVTEVRDLVTATRGVLSGRDLAAASGTLTYFAAIAVVPWLMLGVWTSGWGRSADTTERRMLQLRVLVPPDMGARPAYDALVAAATHLGLLGAVVLLFPASFYGEGLRRACLSIAPAPDRFTGWRARIMMASTVVLVPPLAWAFLAAGDRLDGLAPEGGGGGAADLLVRVVAGFTVLWLVLSVLLTWMFRTVAPGRPRWRVCLVGALATGSFLAGFLHGFQLFLSLPIDVGLPFGGLGVVGGVVAVGLWLYVLHVFLLVGWSATRALDEQVDAHVAGRAT